jgi:hypothetical protein
MTGHKLCSVNSLIPIQIAAIMDVTPWTSIEITNISEKVFSHILCPENGGRRLLRNIFGYLPSCKASHHRKQESLKYHFFVLPILTKFATQIFC